MTQIKLMEVKRAVIIGQEKREKEDVETLQNS